MSTSGCVRATAVEALQFGCRPVVVRDGVADRDTGAHAAALHDLEMKYADVISLAQALSFFEASSPASLDEGGAET
jgi:maleamate amidohydrolase